MGMEMEEAAIQELGMTPENWWTGENVAQFNKADLAGFRIKKPPMIDVAWRMREALDCLMDIRLLDVVETVQKQHKQGLLAGNQLGQMSQEQLMAAIGELEAMIEKSSVVALSLHEAMQLLSNAMGELEGV
jgi:hypothetical protein